MKIKNNLLRKGTFFTCALVAMGLTACDSPQETLYPKSLSPQAMPAQMANGETTLADISQGIRDLNNLNDPRISEIFELIDQLDPNRNLNESSLTAIKNVIDQRKIELLHGMMRGDMSAKEEFKSDLASNLMDMAAVVTNGDVNGLRDNPNAVRVVFEDIKYNLNGLSASNRSLSGLMGELEQLDRSGKVNYQNLKAFVSRIDEQARNFSTKENMSGLREDLKSKTQEFVQYKTPQY